MRTDLDLLLERATTEKEVVAVVCAYLAAWSPTEFKCIPDEFRPSKHRSGADYSAVAHALATKRLSSLEDPCQQLMGELEQVYAHAATRIAMLHLYARKHISMPSYSPRP